MTRVRKLRAEISHHDSAERFSQVRSLGRDLSAKRRGERQLRKRISETRDTIRERERERERYREGESCMNGNILSLYPQLLGVHVFMGEAEFLSKVCTLSLQLSSDVL